MPNYDELFKADNIPKQQETGFTNPTEKPHIPTPPPPTVKSLDNTEPLRLTGKSALAIIICIVAIYFIVNGVPDSVKSEVQSSTSGLSSLTTKKEDTILTHSPNIDLDEIKIVGESLFWVNYTKALSVTDYNVIAYTVRCDSAQLGDFEFNLTHSQFTQIPDGGILPVIATQVKYGNDDSVYYTAFRLHDNWKNLLEGNVN